MLGNLVIFVFESLKAGKPISLRMLQEWSEWATLVAYYGDETLQDCWSTLCTVIEAVPATWQRHPAAADRGALREDHNWGRITIAEYLERLQEL